MASRPERSEGKPGRPLFSPRNCLAASIQLGQATHGQRKLRVLLARLLSWAQRRLRSGTENVVQMADATAPQNGYPTVRSLGIGADHGLEIGTDSFHPTVSREKGGPQ